jgi:hypothetical protein
MKMKKWLAPVLGLSLLVPALAGTQSVNAESATPSTSTPGVELRAGLDYLLSEHFTLAVVAMTKSYDGAADATAAKAALDRNAKDMVPAISSIYGQEGANEFDRIFSAHNSYTEDYVQAVKWNNETKKAEARQELEEFADEFGTFLGTATAGKLPSITAKAAVRTHEMQVLEVFDAYAKGDYRSAYSEFREGLSYMFGVSDALAGAITAQFPEKFNHTSSKTKAGDLRSTLNHLAAEHYALAVLSMQKGYDKSSAYSALLDAQNDNTADFRAAITSIYGAAGGTTFADLWINNHLTAQEDIVTAAIAGDTLTLDAAKAKLTTFSTDFGKFLGTTTESRLPAEAASAAVAAHEKLVLEAFDIYRSADKTGLYDKFREGYKYMFGVGQALGSAIVAQKPELFPVPAQPTQEEIPNDVQSIWFQIDSKVVSVDGENQFMDVAPSLVDGVTVVSLRTLTDTLGANLFYIPEERKVELKLGDDIVEFWLGQTTALVNGVEVELEAPVFVKDNRTQAPLRFIAEWLGWNVKWKNDSLTIMLEKAV